MGLRCMIVEDQLMLQQLLVGMLQRHPALEVVACACTVSEAINACASQCPDLLILDIALPDGDGLSVARALQAFNPNAHAIILSSFASTVERPAELQRMITAILDKSRAYQDLLVEVERLLSSQNDSSTLIAHLSSLTERERDVLRLIGSGQTSRAIATELQISVRTVETHRHNISTKLGINGGTLVYQATLLSRLLLELP